MFHLSLTHFQRHLLKKVITHPAPTELLWDQLSHTGEEDGQNGEMVMGYAEHMERVYRLALNTTANKLFTHDGMLLKDTPSHAVGFLALCYCLDFTMHQHRGDWKNLYPLAELLVMFKRYVPEKELTLSPLAEEVVEDFTMHMGAR